MNWHERMNEAIGYVEDNIMGEIDLSRISRIAGQSAVNFQRMFSIVAGIPLGEYIRRRRMTLAAFEMKKAGARVIDVAMKYGYESPESFTRAFKEIHGVSPTAARKEGIRLKTFPRIAFLLTVKGDTPMDYRIETKQAFKVYGIEGIFTVENGANFMEIPKFWGKCMEDGSFERLIKSTNDPSSWIHAICCYRDTGGNTFPYMLCALTSEKSDTAGFSVVDVPAATWAIFRSGNYTQEETAQAVQNLTKRVYTDWLPTANYKKVEGYEFEMYCDAGDGAEYCELWIRVEPG